MLKLLFAIIVSLVTAPGLIFWGSVIADAVTGWRRWRNMRPGDGR